MAELVIKISDTGTIIVEVDGTRLGMLQVVEIRATARQLLPKVKLVFPPSTLQESSAKIWEAVERSKKRLASFPSAILQVKDLESSDEQAPWLDPFSS